MAGLSGRSSGNRAPYIFIHSDRVNFVSKKKKGCPLAMAKELPRLLVLLPLEKRQQIPSALPVVRVEPSLLLLAEEGEIDEDAVDRDASEAGEAEPVVAAKVALGLRRP
jgi:hypothetical protein